MLSTAAKKRKAIRVFSGWAGRGFLKRPAVQTVEIINHFPTQSAPAEIGRGAFFIKDEFHPKGT